jgi:hypothetical protein
MEINTAEMDFRDHAKAGMLKAFVNTAKDTKVLTLQHGNAMQAHQRQILSPGTDALGSFTRLER